jgi:hypothetical protein
VQLPHCWVMRLIRLVAFLSENETMSQSRTGLSHTRTHTHTHTHTIRIHAHMHTHNMHTQHTKQHAHTHTHTHTHTHSHTHHTVHPACPQTLFFVALFRQGTREAILGWLERVLPTHVPGLPLKAPLAQELHAFVNKSITKFQVGSGPHPGLLGQGWPKPCTHTHMCVCVRACGKVSA